MSTPKWEVSTRPLRGDYTRGVEGFHDMEEALEAFFDRVGNAVGECEPCSLLYQDFVTNRAETKEAYRGYLMGDPGRNIQPAQVLKEIVDIVGVPWLVVLARTE